MWCISLPMVLMPPQLVSHRHHFPSLFLSSSLPWTIDLGVSTYMTRTPAPLSSYQPNSIFCLATITSGRPCLIKCHVTTIVSPSFLLICRSPMFLDFLPTSYALALLYSITFFFHFIIPFRTYIVNTGLVW